MNVISQYEQEQVSQRVVERISAELKTLPTEVDPGLVLNKGQYMLNSEQVHGILARVANDTEISMIVLRRVFPYERYFITYKSGVSISFGVFFLIIALIVFFTDKELTIFLLPLSFLLFTISLLKFLDVGFIRNKKPVLTVQLFTEIIIAIIDKYSTELVFGVQPQERQLWRNKIYEVCSRYQNVFFTEEFSPEIVVPLSDPDEYDLPLMIEECAEIMSLSFDTVDQSGIYEKHLDYDDDELLTVVHFADLLIDFWAENRIKTQKASLPDLP